MRMKRIVVIWIVSVIALVLAATWASLGIVAHSNDDLTETEVTQTGAPLVTAEFTLQGEDNKIVKASELRGKYLLVFFGFTHCKDMCPTTMLMIANALSHVGDKAERIQPVFISVDTKRDTGKTADAYAKRFNPSFIGLAGTPAQMKKATESFKAFVGATSHGGNIDHSGFIYLMGPNGAYITHFSHDTPEAELSRNLSRLVR
jgi:protein SCO1/2